GVKELRIGENALRPLGEHEAHAGDAAGDGLGEERARIGRAEHPPREREMRRKAPVLEREAPRPELRGEAALQRGQRGAVCGAEPPDVAALAAKAPGVVEAE